MLGGCPCSSWCPPAPPEAVTCRSSALTPPPSESEPFASLPSAAQNGLAEGRWFELCPKIGDCSLSQRKRRRGRNGSYEHNPESGIFQLWSAWLCGWRTLHTDFECSFRRFFVLVVIFTRKTVRCGLLRAADATLPAAPPRSWGCARGTLLDAVPPPGLHPTHTLQVLSHLCHQGGSALGSLHKILAFQANHKQHELLSRD